MPFQPLKPDEVKHGEWAGYKWHKSQSRDSKNWEACAGCKEAAAKRSKHRRETIPAEDKQRRLRNKARARALQRLKSLNERLYETLLQEELKKVWREDDSAKLRDGGTRGVTGDT